MLIFTMTKGEVSAFEDLMPKHIFDQVGTTGYFTTAAVDDEGYPLGVLQFYVDGNPENIYLAFLKWIYVIPEARGESIAWQLHDTYKNTLLETKIPISEVVISDDMSADTRDFLLALGYKSLGEGRFILNIPRP